MGKFPNIWPSFTLGTTAIGGNTLKIGHFPDLARSLQRKEYPQGTGPAGSNQALKRTMTMTMTNPTRRTAGFNKVNAAIAASLLSFTLFAVTVAPPSQALQLALTGKTQPTNQVHA
jgi:hypothetical protein